MNADRGPLTPDQRGLLESYRFFLQQARYHQVEERMKAAERCLGVLGPRTRPLAIETFTDYLKLLSEGQVAHLKSFRSYLVRTGWLVEEKGDPVKKRVRMLPESTADLLERYVRQMKRQNLAQGTIALRVWEIVRWVRRCPQEVQEDVRLIDRYQVEAMIEQAQDLGNKPGTINSQLSDLHHFFLFLVREELLEESPVLSRHWLQEPEALPRAMSGGEVSRFLGVIEGTQDCAIFLLLLRTGMRGGELVGLCCEDVDLERRTVHIRHGIAKTAKSRVVYFSEDAAMALKAWLVERGEVPTERVFFCWPHLSLTRGTVNWRFKRYLKLAGIRQSYTAHSLRHTFATELLNAGVSLVSVQELLGHEQIASTQRYARLSGAVKQAEYVAAMAKIEKRYALGVSASGEVSHGLAR